MFVTDDSVLGDHLNRSVGFFAIGSHSQSSQSSLGQLRNPHWELIFPPFTYSENGKPGMAASIKVRKKKLGRVADPDPQ